MTIKNSPKVDTVATAIHIKDSFAKYQELLEKADKSEPPSPDLTRQAWDLAASYDAFTHKFVGLLLDPKASQGSPELPNKVIDGAVGVSARAAEMSILSKHNIPLAALGEHGEFEGHWVKQAMKTVDDGLRFLVGE